MFPYSYTDNLPENFGKNVKNVAQEWKQSTSGWSTSLKNAVA